MDLSLNEIGYWLALYTVPRCGFSTVSMLLEKFANPKQILLASYEELLRAGVSPILASNLQKPDWKRVELCLRWVEQSQRYILHWGDLHYPALLREISSPPLILFMMGELSLLQQQTLAIVGARNPTHTGLEISHQLANELSDQGFVIISGLARGIDGAAHQGAMLGKGRTIAVLGSGFEYIYPTCHQALAMDILEKGGALISEFFPYASPKAEYFPRRNRIISGMSLGIIVIEATLRSGSLITARHALEQGREVFAVPGSIRNPLSQGCHALLKEGATLVESCVDITQGLSFLPEQSNNWTNELISTKFYEAKDSTAKRGSKAIAKNISGLDSQDIKLVECLGFETASIDILMARTGLTVDKLLARLSILQLQGHIDVVPGGYVRK
jgi:DNA processing protein